MSAKGKPRILTITGNMKERKSKNCSDSAGLLCQFEMGKITKSWTVDVIHDEILSLITQNDEDENY